MQVNFSDVDSLKAFAVLLLGAAVGAILVYVYDSSIAPHLKALIPSKAAA